MTDTTTLLLDPLDELLVARHSTLVTEVLDRRTELMRLEQLMKARSVPFESYFPSARTAPAASVDVTETPGLAATIAGAWKESDASAAVAQFAASTALSTGSQPAGGVSGVIPPATPDQAKKPATKAASKAVTSNAKPTGEKRSLQCAQCGRVFASFGGLRIHQGRSGHAGQTTPSATPAPAELSTGTDALERQPAPPVPVIDDDTMALRCDDCSFAAPVGPLQPLRVHVLEVHKRVLSNTERKPRLVVE
jgi:hypothetical protein